MAPMHLKSRLQRKLLHRLQDVKAIVEFLAAVCQSYRLAELLPLLPLVLCLGTLSLFPDWVLSAVDACTEWGLCLLLGGKRARLRDAAGRETGDKCLYSIVGALDPEFGLPDPRLLCVPETDAEAELAFPSPAAAGWGNAAFLAMCMKLAYEDWQVVRDVVNHEWRLDGTSTSGSSPAPPRPPAGRRHLLPRFIQGSSFHFMQPAGTESSEELSHIHLDSDAVVLAVEDPGRPAPPSAAGAKGAGVAIVLAFRGTEPLELADFNADFDAVPEAGEWGCLHPGFLLALGLDPNLSPYHQTLTTYSALQGDAAQPVVLSGRRTTPYEVLRDLVVSYLNQHPGARLYVTGHSLGGALAVVFMGALMHDLHLPKATKAHIGALYTFGQPRVGDYEFLCHLSVSMLEPTHDGGSSSGSAAGAAAAGQAGGSASASGSSGHHVEHATTHSGASKLRALMAGGKQPDGADGHAGPPLTSRYIRVANTFDVVTHIPPPLMHVYQHGGDLLYLSMKPGCIRYLTEQPMFFITGIWSSSLVKLHHYAGVALGLNKTWKGRDNYIRFGLRVAAVLVPFLVGGLNDHMPGDYAAHIINSAPADWQPFKARKKLSRWVNAIKFTRALSVSNRSGAAAPSADGHGADAAAATAPAANGAAAATTATTASGRGPLSARLQARLMAHSEKAVQGGGLLHRRPAAGAAVDGGATPNGARASPAAAAAPEPAAAQEAADASAGGAPDAARGPASKAANVNAKLKALAHKVSAGARHEG